jgi:1-acyl-sn-glycerol-3-phosphate acyltransferase
MAKRGHTSGGAGADLVAPLVEAIGAGIRNEKSADPFQRDPTTVEWIVPLLRPSIAYHGVELRGWENLPTDGPVLIVGNHSGGASTGDMFPLFVRWVDELGPEAPLYSLAYDLLFTYPIVGPLLRKTGVLPASPENGLEALRRGYAVVVFPGGDYEVFRPWAERNRIEFHGHKGFVRLALEAGVPVVPMTIHGAHQSTLVVTRGRGIARTVGLNKLHIKVFPFIWNIPFGVTPAFIPSAQLPSKITVELGEPIDWSHFGRRAAKNARIVQRCYGETVEIMQATLDRLAEEHPYPVMSRLDELRPGRMLWKASAGLRKQLSSFLSSQQPRLAGDARASRRRGLSRASAAVSSAESRKVPAQRKRRRKGARTPPAPRARGRVGRAKRPSPS